MKTYTLYKGENILAFGTMKQIAEKLNVKVKTIYFYTTPAWKKRCKKSINRRELVES